MILKQFINLRDELSNIAFNANCFTTIAAGSDRSSEVDVSQVEISGLFCQVDNMHKLHIYQKDQDNPDYLDELSQYSLDSLPDHLSDIIPSTSLSVSDLLETSSSTGDLYSTLSMLTQKYSYSNRISLQDLFYQIDNIPVTRSLNYNVDDLKQQLLAMSNDDGFVSNKCWLTALSEWIKSCKEGADNQYLELDNTSPSVLSGLYNVVMNLLSATVTAVFTALSAVFGAVMLLIGTTISNLFSAIYNGLNESGTLYPDSINNFAKGPVIAREESLSGTTEQLARYVTGNTKVFYDDLPSVGFFWWAGPNYSIRMNAYLHPTFSPESFIRWINAYNNNRGVHWEENSGVINVWRDQSVNLQYDIYPEVLSSEINQMEQDLGYWSASLCVTEFVRWLTSTPYKLYNGSEWKRNEIFFSDHAQVISPSTLPANKFAAIVKTGFLVIYGLKEYGDIYKFISRPSVIDMCNEFIEFAYQTRDNFTDLYPHFNWDAFDASWQNTNILVYGNPLVNATFISNSDVFSYWGAIFRMSEDTSAGIYGWAVTSYEFVLNGNTIVESDMLPTSFLVEFNSLTSSAISSTLLISSMVVIAGAVTALKVSKAIRLKKLKRDFKRNQAIADKKAIYDDWRNPNREGGPKTPEEINAALDDYVKSVDKYNRMGRIFGWGSYDIKNGWANAANDGDSNPILMSSVMDMFQNERNDRRLDTSEQNTDLEDIIDNKIKYYLYESEDSIYSAIMSILNLIR